MSTVAVVASLDEIAQTMTDKVSLIISSIDEIAKTNPVLELRLIHNETDGLVIVADISFPNSRHLSPMEFSDQLIATELIKIIVNKHFARTQKKPQETSLQ